MPVTTAERKYAQLMLRDRAVYVNPGIPVALRTTMRLMQRVINGYGRGERQFRHIIERTLEPFRVSLRDGMATGNLMGARRSILHAGVSFQQQGEYDEALRFLQRRLKLTNGDVSDVREFYNAPASRVIDKVADNIDQALQRTMVRITEQGLHVREAKTRLALVFDKLGLTPKHRATLEAIYRTQTQLAYSAGQWAYNELPAVQEILWGYKYSAVGDERTREEHAMLDGTALPKDDARWGSIFPPNGWNCRCVAIEIYRTISVVEPPGPVLRGNKFIIPGPDPGFDFNPGQILDAVGRRQAFGSAILQSGLPN